MDDRLYFRQLLSGRDYAASSQMARQMVNFTYAIGDRKTGECVLVDPAYAVSELTDLVEAEGLRVTGVLATHYHADHVGGSMMGHTIEGVADLLRRTSVPVHVNKHEVPWVTRTTGLGESELVAHDSGDIVKVGDDITVKCLGVDEKGRVRLSRKAAMEDRDKEMAGEAPKAPAQA